jgi:iron complex transport system substrate-binding protein
VRLERPATRIVTLAPQLTELVFAAGAGERLVGVSANSDYPPPARTLPVVGGAGRIDLERILALRPDLVLAWGAGGQQVDVERLRALSIPVVVLTPRRLADIPRHLELIGRLAGTAYDATRAAFFFRERLAGLRTRYAGRRPVTVFYEIWHEPLMTINGEHIISEAIEVCGGRNVFANLPAATPTLSMEALAAADPEVIVTSGPSARRASLLAQWQGMTRLRAVAAGRVFFSDADLLHRPTPRMLDGIAALCEALERARRSQAD